MDIPHFAYPLADGHLCFYIGTTENTAIKNIYFRFSWSKIFESYDNCLTFFFLQGFILV
jgi:hypothetical protein